MPDIFINKAKEEKPEVKTATVTQIPLKHPIFSNENHIHSLAAFCINPGNFSFHAQDPDEKILLVLRRHFMTNISWIFFTFIFSIIPLSLFFLGISLFEFLNISLSSKVIALFAIIYYLILFTYALLNFLDWFYNVTILTDIRIADIDYSGLLYHNVAITKLSQIEEVNYTKTGFLRSLFNYGDVYAQTEAATIDTFDMLAVPQPEKIANFISDLIEGKDAI